MMHAYDEQYLDDAMRNLGEAADYAVNACGISLQKFFDLFFTIYWVVMAIICFTGTIPFSPFGMGMACLVASCAFSRDLF